MWPKMPKYKCHKEVSALKIKEIWEEIDWTPVLTFENWYGEIHITKEWNEKHKPEEWWYFVVYADWYKSYSPAKAFEDWYSLIEKEMPDPMDYWIDR